MSRAGDFTNLERDEILLMPKAINEMIRWVPQKGSRPFHRVIRVEVVPIGRPGFQREIHLFAESKKSRTGRFTWSIGIRVSGLRENLIRFDTHDNPHKNKHDGTEVNGCMMHLWSTEHLDRHAISASEFIDCSSVESALPDALKYCNIKHHQGLQKRFGDDIYG